MGVHGRHVHVVRHGHGECGMGACLLLMVVDSGSGSGRPPAGGWDVFGDLSC